VFRARGIAQNTGQVAPYMPNVPEIPHPKDSWRNYQIVIRESRYGGIYESGKWFAMANCETIPSDDLMEYLHGDDSAAWDFFDNPENVIGVGNTPNEAHLDLIRKINNAKSESTPSQSNRSVQE